MACISKTGVWPKLPKSNKVGPRSPKESQDGARQSKHNWQSGKTLTWTTCARLGTCRATWLLCTQRPQLHFYLKLLCCVARAMCLLRLLRNLKFYQLALSHGLGISLTGTGNLSSNHLIFHSLFPDAPACVLVVTNTFYLQSMKILVNAKLWKLQQINRTNICL